MSNNTIREFELKKIQENIVQELSTSILLFSFLKSYFKEKNTKNHILIIKYLQKFINIFYKNHPKNIITIFTSIDKAISMAKSITKSIIKSKYS